MECSCGSILGFVLQLQSCICHPGLVSLDVVLSMSSLWCLLWSLNVYCSPPLECPLALYLFAIYASWMKICCLFILWVDAYFFWLDEFILSWALRRQKDEWKRSGRKGKFKIWVCMVFFDLGSRESGIILVLIEETQEDMSWCGDCSKWADLIVIWVFSNEIVHLQFYQVFWLARCLCFPHRLFALALD